MSDQDLARVARQSADESGARLSDIPTTQSVLATVDNATAGSLAVTWKGASVPVAGKNKNYTPVIGDRVKCSLVDGQLLIDYAIDGQP